MEAVGERVRRLFALSGIAVTPFDILSREGGAVSVLFACCRRMQFSPTAAFAALWLYLRCQRARGPGAPPPAEVQVVGCVFLSGKMWQRTTTTAQMLRSAHGLEVSALQTLSAAELHEAEQWILRAVCYHVSLQCPVWTWITHLLSSMQVPTSETLLTECAAMLWQLYRCPSNFGPGTAVARAFSSHNVAPIAAAVINVAARACGASRNAVWHAEEVAAACPLMLRAVTAELSALSPAGHTPLRLTAELLHGQPRPVARASSRVPRADDRSVSSASTAQLPPLLETASSASGLSRGTLPPLLDAPPAESPAESHSTAGSKRKLSCVVRAVSPSGAVDERGASLMAKVMGQGKRICRDIFLDKKTA